MGLYPDMWRADVMLKRRRQYSARFKFQMALEALMGLKTMSQLAAEHQVHPNQITKWKRRLMDEGAQVFDHRTGGDGVPDALVGQLYEQIGRMKMELEWLKKVAPFNQ